MTSERDNMINKQTHHILVVEDYPNWQELLNTILIDDGYSVDITSNMLDALQLIQNHAYDVVVIDIRLEDEQKHSVDGLALLKELKELTPELSAVIITGYHKPEYKDKALNDLDAGAYILKATDDDQSEEVFTIDGFREVIRDLIQRRNT